MDAWIGKGGGTGLDVPTSKALFLEQGKADEIHQIPEKTTTTDNDIILIEDSEDGYKKKRVLAKNLKGKTGVDNAELWKQNTDYKADDVFHFSTSNITAKWANGSPITANNVYFAKYLVDTTSSNDLTNAEMAKLEVVSDGEKIDSSNFKAVGDENSIGINKDDNTLQKVINKVEDFKVTVPKAFEKVTLATDANLTALQALEPTTTKDDLLFEFKASDGTKSYIVTPLDSFIDLKAIKQIEYKSLDEDETILKITTIEGVESELDLKRFLAEKADKSWITSNADVDSDPQKHALFKGSDIYEVMQSMGTIIVAGDTFNIDDAMRGKPTTYTIIVTPDDTTKIQFTGQKWIEDAKYVSDEITLSKQQSLIIYNGESWKAKFVNSHSLPTKNLDVTDEFYEAKFTTQFVNIKMTHATPKIRFFLGTNGSTVIHNDGDKDFEVYGYISTAGKDPLGDIYTLHGGETAIYNHLLGDASFVVIAKPDLVDKTTFTGTLATDLEDIVYNKLKNKLVKKTPNKIHNITVSSIEPDPIVDGTIEEEYQLKHDLTDVKQWVNNAWITPFSKSLYVQGMVIDVDNPKQRYMWDKATNIFIKQGFATGLRLDPIALEADLHKRVAKDYQIVKALDTGNEFIFKLTAYLTAQELIDPRNISDDADTGKWVIQQFELGKNTEIITGLDNGNRELQQFTTKEKAKSLRFYFRLYKDPNNAYESYMTLTVDTFLLDLLKDKIGYFTVASMNGKDPNVEYGLEVAKSSIYLKKVDDTTFDFRLIKSGYEKAGNWADRSYGVHHIAVEYPSAISDGTTADMSAYMLKSDYDKNNNKVVDDAENITGDELTQAEVDNAYDNA